MTPNEMIAYIASKFGNIGDLLDSQILTELQLVQTELEKGTALPHELLVEKYADTTADENRLQIPTDFLREYEESALWFVDSDGFFQPLKKGHQDSLRSYWDKNTGTTDSDTEGPRAYSLIGGYFYIYPRPSTTYRVRMYYYKSDDTLTSGGAANQWSTYYADLLLGKAGRRLLGDMGHLHDDTAQSLHQEFASMAAAGERRLIINNTAREMANMEMNYGGG